MKKKKIVMSVLIATVLASCVACGSINDNKGDTLKKDVTEKVTVSDTEIAEEVEPVDIKVDDLKPLADAGVITGVKDITVAEGTDVKLNDLVYADNTIVKSVDVDDSAVDYSKAGTYDVIYTITFDGEALRDYVKDNNLKLDFDTDSDTIVVKTTVTVTVATKEDADAAIAAGNTDVVTTETKESVAESNKAKANNNATVSKPADKPANSAGNSNSGNTGGNSNTPADNKPSSGGNSNGNSGNTGNSDNKPSEPTKPSEPAHVHKYVEVSRTNPTCTADGVITKKCSCGDVITEKNGSALGHNMVHHDAVTHTEQKLVSDAYDEPIYKNGYECNACGAFFDNDDDALDHTLFDCTHDATYSRVRNHIAGYKHHDAVYETVTITDAEAYTACSRCGAK